MAFSEHPLVLTLTLDDSAFRFFNALRRQHFPPERNHLDAHLTLFHHLPGAEAEAIIQALEEVSRQEASINLSVSEVRLLGKGVAYRLESKPLQQLHRRLQKEWHHWLTAQDQQKLWPHITVQNKVSVCEAKTLHEQLSQGFEPFAATGIGLHLWEYRGGPWQSWRKFEFDPGGAG